MSRAILSTAMLAIAVGVDSAHAELFIPGDVTPVYSLTSQMPHHGREPTVRGNQDLFRRFIDGSVQPRVVIWHGRYFGADAVGELHAFYNLQGAWVHDFDAPSSEHIGLADLLIIGHPDWTWTDTAITSVSSVLERGAHVLVMLEAAGCTGQACTESTTILLRKLGSALRIGRSTSSGTQWGLPADQGFMRGVGPVAYGATFTVEGGTPLMYETEGLSMFSVDEAPRTP